MGSDKNSEEQTHPAAVGGQPIDFSANSGAVDASARIYEQDTPTYDSIGDAVTLFNVEDVSTRDRRDWSKLKQTDAGKRHHIPEDSNREQWQEKVRQYHRGRDIQRMVTFCHIDEKYVPIAMKLVKQIDFNNEGTNTFEGAILAAITIVCNMQDFDPRSNNPIDSPDQWDHESRYEELREINNVDRDTVKSFRTQMSLDDV